jgi:hypothetical protein
MKRNKLMKKYAKEILHDAWKKIDTDRSYHDFMHFVSVSFDDEYVIVSVDGSSIKMKPSQAKIDALKTYMEVIDAERTRDT